MTLHYSAIILSAGMGTRMKSTMPKVMHKIAGRPMVSHVIANCELAGVDKICVVIGPDMDDLATLVSPHQTVIQHDRLGTGHAAMQAESILGDDDGYVFILNGDGPFITPNTLKSLAQSAQKTGLAVLGCDWENPHGYGRFIIKDDIVTEIVEEKDCTDAQRTITIANTGVYCVKTSLLFNWLKQVKNTNAQGEYYLTDIVSIATNDGVNCAYALAPEVETIGINSRAQLAQAESIMQDQLRQKAMDGGVTMIDPSSVYLSMDTEFGQDIIIEPNVVIGTGVRVGSHTTIFAFSHIEGATIGEHSEIGPYARIRPKSKIGNHVSVGNFIEINRSELKDGAKSKHVSYLGDAIIGEKSNIGAGTVFANYDGFNKHTSTTGKNVFVGSNSTIISPVQIGDDAIIAGGSVIASDIDADAIAIVRADMVVKNGVASKYRARKKAIKESKGKG